MGKAAKHWTESEVRSVLARRYKTPAYAMFASVRNGTGFARKQARTADALVLSCYPSRGIYLTGIEIKVTLSDWRREVEKVGKAEEFQQYCRYWYAAAPKGVIPVGEVPENWGLLEVTRQGVSETKTAPKLEPVDPDWLLVASVIRNFRESMVTIAERDKAVARATESDQKTKEDAAKLFAVEYEFEAFKKTVRKFEDASGVQINRWRSERIGDAVRRVMNGEADRAPENRLRNLLGVARNIVSELESLEKPDTAESTA